jgi:hypothetical protein
MRDRDVRNAIHDALVATGSFDGVWIWGPPEDYGGGASQLAAAAIEPESSTQEDRWDSAAAGGLIITSRVTLTLLQRHDDPQLRDEAAERLFDSAANALNGQSFAVAPERRITSTFSYSYIVEGWNAYDDTA